MWIGVSHISRNGVGALINQRLYRITHANDTLRTYAQVVRITEVQFEQRRATAATRPYSSSVKTIITPLIYDNGCARDRTSTKYFRAPLWAAVWRAHCRALIYAINVKYLSRRCTHECTVLLCPRRRRLLEGSAASPTCKSLQRSVFQVLSNLGERRLPHRLSSLGKRENIDEHSFAFSSHCWVLLGRASARVSHRELAFAYEHARSTANQTEPAFLISFILSIDK